MTTLSLLELMRSRSTSRMGLNPFSWYRLMRLIDPIVLDEQNRLCELFRYDDIQSVFANPVLFSSKQQLDDERERGSPAFVDPPRHKKLRSLVSQQSLVRWRSFVISLFLSQ
jgi:cytochrome P450